MTAAKGICGVVVGSSWHDPVACAFQKGHEGVHSWASIPQFAPTPQLSGMSLEEYRKLASAERTCGYCGAANCDHKVVEVQR